MSTLAADVQFDFSFPPCEPVTPPSYSLDPTLLEVPSFYGTSHSHARSSSHGSSYSMASSLSEACSVNTHMTTPARSPIRSHGPLLLPKIRSQDQNLTAPKPSPVPSSKRRKTTPTPKTTKLAKVTKNTSRSSHARSFTNPEFLTSNFMPTPDSSFSSQLSGSSIAPQLLCSPVSFVQPQEYDFQGDSHVRRASSCNLDSSVMTQYGYMPFTGMSTYLPAATSALRSYSVPPMPTTLQVSDCISQQQMYASRAPSPLAAALPITPEPESLPIVPSTTLLSYLTSANPAPGLVRSVSYPLRDATAKDFWWDVRQVRPWANFTAASLLALPGASNLLNYAVPETYLPTVPTSQGRHPDTESALYNAYANFYLPKLNHALRVSSARPLQLSSTHGNDNTMLNGSPPPTTSSPHEPVFVATNGADPSSASAIFGGNPSARVVGLVKSYDRFNTGMRVEGNVKKVEYLRGLAHLHRIMREHGCRYGFILTEIELVVVRNGSEATPDFGFLEVVAVQTAVTATKEAEEQQQQQQQDIPLTACLALWGLCMLAGDEALVGHAHWRSEIGAPAEGTRRKAQGRDTWMPTPQLAEKRMAKRVRGWVWPEDPIGRKELGKRGVKYGGIKGSLM